MRIRFHGAARTVTGSMHLLEANGRRLVFDCGLSQGHRQEAFELNRNLPADVRGADGLILSHAHIDHSGNLPSLVKAGFRGAIHTTPATRDLCEIMLADSAHMQEADVRFANKLRALQGKRPFEPLYAGPDVPPTLARFQPLAYGQPREVLPGVTATFRDAGHILGSAITALDVAENGRRARLVFTGDLGRPGTPILRDPETFESVDALVIESTYGDRLHPRGEDVKGRLGELMARVTARKSKLVVPAFSVGRTQEILYFLHELWKAGRVPALPVFVDSPLSTKATAVYAAHPECYDAAARELLAGGEGPFSMRGVTFVAEKADSQALNDRAGPLMIISASGMCEGGRVLHHLKHSVADPANVILLVGFQAEHTLGRRIQERQPYLKIFGEEYPLRAEVESLSALSAHADRDELLGWFQKLGKAPRKVFVVHGEPPASEALAERLRALGAPDVSVPAPGDEAEV